MIQIFADDEPDQQADGRHAAVDHGGGNLGGGHALTGPAGVLRADVAMHDELRRDDVELFTHILADFNQRRTAFAASARFRLMPMFDARQVIGQWLPTGAFAFAFGAGLGLRGGLFGFGFAGGNVGGQSFLKQVALFRVQRLALGAETDAAQMGEFEGERLDLGFGVLEGGVQPEGFGGLFLQPVEQRMNGDFR